MSNTKSISILISGDLSESEDSSVYKLSCSRSSAAAWGWGWRLGGRMPNLALKILIPVTGFVTYEPWDLSIFSRALVRCYGTPP